MRRLLALLALVLIPALASPRNGVTLLYDRTVTNPTNLDTGVLGTGGCDTLLIWAFAGTAAATNVGLLEATTGSNLGNIASLTAASASWALSIGPGLGATGIGMPVPARTRVTGTTGASGTLRVRIECGRS